MTNRILAKWRSRAPRPRPATPNSWTDSMTGRPDEETQRYLEIPQIDRWRSVGHEMAPAPQRGLVELRVQQLVEALGPESIDEGTSAALDLLIDGWVGTWMEQVDHTYIDGCAVVDVHYGQAAEWLVDAESSLEFETATLLRLRSIRDDAQARLAGTSTKED